MNVKLLIEWLKEPSTLKAIVVILGLAGYTLVPAQVEALSLGVGAAYALLSAFYDRQPRKPEPCPPPGESVK